MFIVTKASGILLLLLLLGCGGTQDTSTQETSTEATAEVSPEPDSPAIQNSTPAISASIPTFSVSNPASWSVSEDGIGPAQVGMTLGELKQTLGDEFTFEQNPQFMVDWGAIAILQEEIPLFYILHPAGMPLREGEPIELLLTDNSVLLTAEGIGPGTPIRQAAKVYGFATLSYNIDDEMREYVRFANAPDHLSFRTSGDPEDFVGIYQNSDTGGYYETQEFDRQGTIGFILVDGYGRSANLVAEQASKQSAPTQDCTNPETTRAINACSKQAYEKADQRLNRVYQTLLPNLNAREQDQLIQVQTAWINFRDAHCTAVTYPMTEGSAYPSFLNGCLTEVTEIRIGQLRTVNDELPPSDQRSTNLGRVTVNGQEIDCDNPLGTPVINYCAGLAYSRADQELNQVYQQLTAELETGAENQVIDAQLAWLEFRDLLCNFRVRNAQGGTGYEAYRNNCLENLTRDRTQQLMDWMT